jgi:DNA-binding transcriptional ArsR family regulator
MLDCYDMDLNHAEGCASMEGLDERALEEVADFFGAFAVPMRLRILNALRHGERNVSDLTAEFGCSQANISKHLSLLAQKGLIAKEAHGTSAFYRILDPRIYQLCDLVCSQIGQRFAQQAELKDMFVRASRPAAKPKARRTSRGR